MEKENEKQQVESVFLRKMNILKSLIELRQNIDIRPKWYTTSKGQKIKTENLPKIQQGDAKYIQAVIFNSNPIFYIGAVRNTKGRMIDVVLETDLNLNLDTIKKFILENVNMTIRGNRTEFVVYNEICEALNCIMVKYLDSLDGQQKELYQFVSKFYTEMNKCINTLQKIEFQEKKTSIKICNNNMELCKIILDKYGDGSIETE